LFYMSVKELEPVSARNRLPANGFPVDPGQSAGQHPATVFVSDQTGKTGSLVSSQTMTSRPLISILDADPELGAGLSGDARDLARRPAVAAVHALPTGPFEFPVPNGESAAPAVGLLVLDGLITRDVELAKRSTTELLGQGDIIRPWDDEASLDPLPGSVSWAVLEPARVAVLDRRFAAVAGRWPSMLDTVVGRTVRRSRQLSVQRAIAQVPRVDARVLVLLWLLADRWGRVSPQGVRVPLSLTHETIGKLVGARRPSVTTALGVLTRRGLVERTDSGWLLHGDPQEALPELL
jgi:CRP/FNR family transcriptional regulator, cyclic AMP receptor protein